MSKTIKQPVPSKQIPYTAAVRISLDVSRGYLATAGFAILPTH
mgnify:CR=1 FL=1